MSQTITCEHDIYSAISRVKYLMKDLPFTTIDVQSVIVSLMEMARNVLMHGGGNGHFICRTIPLGICMIVSDRGPGIPDLEAVMEGSKRSDKGLGLGISGTIRLMDEVRIETSRKGTKVIAIKRYT